MNADYLFHEDNDHSWDLGDRGLQCGRKVDALKLWFSWQVHLTKLLLRCREKPQPIKLKTSGPCGWPGQFQSCWITIHRW